MWCCKGRTTSKTIAEQLADYFVTVDGDAVPAASRCAIKTLAAFTDEVANR